MKIEVQVLHPTAVVPEYAQSGDAGCDLVSIEEVVLAPGARALVSTGLAVAIPPGHGGFVLPRSGLASRHGVTCANAPGLIDAGYRGEVKIALVNLDRHETYVVHAGDRIAQLVVLPVEPATFTVVDELSASERGVGGFGSTGR